MTDTLASPKKVNPGPSRSGRQLKRLRRWIVVITLLATGLGIFFGIRMFGYVQGEEFSPRTFRQRTFSFYEIPF
ncbi:MAG: hypothetical protein AAF989_00225, partial [Planctomycetota bacterium]